jgi:hypothetical protein
LDLSNITYKANACGLATAVAPTTAIDWSTTWGGYSQGDKKATSFNTVQDCHWIENLKIVD